MCNKMLTIFKATKCSKAMQLNTSVYTIIMLTSPVS